jgi:multidrug efflux pump subunit AcrA (membrane-fusion protein)
MRGSGVWWLPLVASLAACGAESKAPVAAEPPPAVEIALVEGASVSGALTVSGVLERERESALSFRTGRGRSLR